MPITATLQPHQQRVVERMLGRDHGLLIAHGLGSGKTLTSIAVQEALGVDATIVVPASLIENYQKEVALHAPGSKLKRNILSLQAVARNSLLLRDAQAKLFILDEGHRSRNGNSKMYDSLVFNDTEYRMVLTASPFYDHPSDIAVPLHLVDRNGFLIDDPSYWNMTYIEELEGDIGYGKTGVSRQFNPRFADQFRKEFARLIDYHPNTTKEYPRVKRSDVLVSLSVEQESEHDRFYDEAPLWMGAMVGAMLAPHRGNDTSRMNAFLCRTRQICNLGPRSESPKVDAAFNQMVRTLAQNPRAKVLFYSNFLESGVHLMRKRLLMNSIPFGEFTGEIDAEVRKRAVENYNAGKIRVLLVSAAGGEGLDLKGTRLVQILEPAWNQERIGQVEGRAIRFRSHSHLPVEEQEVLVQRFISVRDSGRGFTTDEYLAKMMDDKDALLDEFRALLPKESES